MTDRLVCKVFCGRSHRIGSVLADASGIRVEYQAAVHTKDRPRAAVAEVWRPSDSADAAEAWCRHCRKVYPVFLTVLAREERRQVFLTAEGMWSDPIGVSSRKVQR